jgi:hypothetical protein
MKRAAWVDLALFVLTRRFVCSLAITVLTVICWWYLADYYVMQRLPLPPTWLDRLLDLVASAGGHHEVYSTLVCWLEPLSAVLPSAAFVLMFCWLTRRQIRNGLGQENENDLAILDFGPIGADGLRHMLLFAAGHCEGVTQKYVLWLRDRQLRGPRAWAYGSWLVLLWLFLALPFLHSGVMEWIAASMSTPQNGIFNFRAYIDNASLSSREVFPLERNRGTNHWTVTPEVATALAVWERATLQTAAGDLPHLHRVISVHCVPPSCWLPGAPVSQDSHFRVQAGLARFDFGKFPTEPLKMNIVLLTLWGRELHSTTIDQK